MTVAADNVAVIRRLAEAFDRRDAKAIEDLWDPEGEFMSSIGEVSGESFKGGGLPAVKRYLQMLDDAWAEWRVEELELISVDDGRVLQLHVMRGEGRGSGVPVEQPVSIIWTVRDGKVLLGEGFLDQEQGREAVGLA